MVLTLIGLAALAGAAWRVLRWHVRRSLLAVRAPAPTPSPFAGAPLATAAGAAAAGQHGSAPPGQSGQPGQPGQPWDVPFFTSPPTPPATTPPPAVPAPAVPTGFGPLVPAPRRPLAAVRPFPKVSVGLCLVVALVCGALVGKHAWLQHRLTVVATALAGTRATVHCQTFGETWTDATAELGFVKYGSDGVPEHHTVIKWDPCRALSSWMGSDHHSWTQDELIAVHVLTHEAMHMRGETVEARAECQAMQRDAVTARLLGASPTDARRLARAYWLTVYPRMSGDYTAPQCTPDGPWDEHLPDAPWLRQPAGS